MGGYTIRPMAEIADEQHSTGAGWKRHKGAVRTKTETKAGSSSFPDLTRPNARRLDGPCRPLVFVAGSIFKVPSQDDGSIRLGLERLAASCCPSIFR